MYLMLQVIFGGHIFGPVVNILYNKYNKGWPIFDPVVNRNITGVGTYLTFALL